MLNRNFSLFWEYVDAGKYSQFVRDLLKNKSNEEVRKINREIREIYLNLIRDEFFEFGAIRLDEDDSTVLVQDESFLRGVEPTFVRLMIGNHGPYLEFTEPLDRGSFIRQCRQYDWYERNGKKLYAQFETVNYADYRAGLWYVCLYQAMNVKKPQFNKM